MKKILLILVLLVSVTAFSQSVNDYQYVIVPSKFNEFKENDKYHLNTSVKLLLQKYGFKSFLSTDSIPLEIVNSNCNKLYADIERVNNLLSTKVKIVLKDCKEKILYETAYGKSNEKELVIAYNMALREAAKSFDKLNYKYNGKNGIAPEVTISEKITDKTQSLDIIKSTPTSSQIPTDNAETFYFAQPIANGYQIVDTEPKVIMKLFNTSQKNVFMGVKGDINGTVILKNGQWFFEYYENGKLVSELLKLKF